MHFRTAITVLLLSTISGCGGQPSRELMWHQSQLPRTASDEYWSYAQMVGDEQGRPNLVVLEIKSPDMKPCLSMPTIIREGLLFNGFQRERPTGLTLLYNDRAGELKKTALSEEAAQLFAKTATPNQDDVTKFWESLNP